MSSTIIPELHALFTGTSMGSTEQSNQALAYNANKIIQLSLQATVTKIHMRRI
jgi:hypothetical protein